MYVILLILAEAQSCSLTSDHGPLLIITGDTKVSEETICADVYVEAHISSGRRAVFQACDLQYLYLVYIKNRIIIPDHCLYMAPLVQGNGVHAILVILYPKISQIGKCISGKRKILAAMDLSYRIAAVLSVCRPYIEGFEFPTIFCSPEGNANKASGIVRRAGKK